MLKLNETDYIAKGNERVCYKHPDNEDKLVKVEYIAYKDRNQNVIEKAYYAYLEKRKVSYIHITKFYGAINTNHGEGLIFEYIKNFDNTTPKTFEDVIKEKQIPKEEIDDLLNRLRIYLEENGIVFGDPVLSNLAFQKIAPSKFRLVIVDGLGARRVGLRFWLQMHSNIYNKFRIRKQWKKLMNRYSEL